MEIYLIYIPTYLLYFHSIHFKSFFVTSIPPKIIKSNISAGAVCGQVASFAMQAEISGKLMTIHILRQQNDWVSVYRK